MSAPKPRLLIVFAHSAAENSTRFGGFVKRMQKQGGFKYADVDYVALEDLLFHIKNETEARVYDPMKKIDFKNYAFVYFKSWQSQPELAASAALYLEAMGIPYADRQARHEYIAKTSNYMAMWAHHVSVPGTVWGSKETLMEYVRRHRLTYPLIIKSVHGQKGKDNFLAASKQEALKILEEANVSMLLQQFIPNDGDYRIGVYGHEARWGIYRRSGGSSHLNNTSAGATAELLDPHNVQSEILRLAEAASEACDLAVSGVDVVEDKVSKKLYVFEANQGSQIVTGAFAESNMRAFDAGMKAMISHRSLVKTRQLRQVIGRDTRVGIEGIPAPFSVLAKVDTGAYQSSLHVEAVALHRDDDGKEFVEYSLKDPKTEKIQTVRAYDFGRALIKNSFGVEQKRFVVPMTLRIKGVQYETRVSLADRKMQKYPMLIGRKLLQGNFFVNIELSE